MIYRPCSPFNQDSLSIDSPLFDALTRLIGDRCTVVYTSQSITISATGKLSYDGMFKYSVSERNVGISFQDGDVKDITITKDTVFVNIA